LQRTASGEEYLWQGDPDVWSGRAPILFPVVGSLKNDTMRIAGRDYQMARHGLARKAEFSLDEQSDTACTFRWLSDIETRKNYPWQFELRVRFSLDANLLTIGYEVTNEDSEEMIFTLGSHPAFALPDKVDDYSIRFSEVENPERFMLDSDGLLAVNSNPFNTGQRVQLNDQLFNDDALVFKNVKSREIALFHNEERRLTLTTGGAPHLGIWAKPAAQFVCIEPWFGYSDAPDSNGLFEEKPSMLRLKPNKTWAHHLTISIA